VRGVGVKTFTHQAIPSRYFLKEKKRKAVLCRAADIIAVLSDSFTIGYRPIILLGRLSLHHSTCDEHIERLSATTNAHRKTALENPKRFRARRCWPNLICLASHHQSRLCQLFLDRPAIQFPFSGAYINKIPEPSSSPHLRQEFFLPTPPP
jgi:hypothetical protein